MVCALYVFQGEYDGIVHYTSIKVSPMLVQYT